MSQTPIPINGANYMTGRLAPIPAFHVTRRLLPILTGMGMAPSDLMRMAAAPKEEDLFSLVGPALDVIAKMSNDDADYILLTCLSVCKREQGTAWAPVVNDRGQFMFQDMDLPCMVRLAIEVLKGNLTQFFASPPDAASP